MIIDTHCHLFDPKYTDIEQIWKDSCALGVPHCISQGTHPLDWEKQLGLSRQYPEFIASCLAVHPIDCMETAEDDMERLAALCRSNVLAAIGEAGLDYFWDPPQGITETVYHARQRELLERHFALADELGLNISLHTRDKQGTSCFDDAFAIARQFPHVRPVFHCFIGTRAQADAIFEILDGMVSFTGLITFKKTEAIQDVAAWCPEDRLMVETDGPYLSPEPYRGRLNFPGRTWLVVEKIANLRGCSVEQIAAQTTLNAQHFFRLPAEWVCQGEQNQGLTGENTPL